jgi:hypothetical protein
VTNRSGNDAARSAASGGNIAASGGIVAAIREIASSDERAGGAINGRPNFQQMLLESRPRN